MFWLLILCFLLTMLRVLIEVGGLGFGLVFLPFSVPLPFSVCGIYPESANCSSLAATYMRFQQLSVSLFLIIEFGG